MAKSTQKDEKIAEKLQNLYGIAEHDISWSDILYKNLWEQINAHAWLKRRLLQKVLTLARNWTQDTF